MLLSRNSTVTQEPTEPLLGQKIKACYLHSYTGNSIYLPNSQVQGLIMPRDITRPSCTCTLYLQCIGGGAQHAAEPRGEAAKLKQALKGNSHHETCSVKSRSEHW